jgi:ubiquinone/menaquinone biosynthesis C-methylase UbiE
MMIWILIGAAVIIIGLLLYWQLILAEGAYLGAPLVALMYDWTAERYNKIKDFDPELEAFTLGTPLANRLAHQPEAPVLDVATGTGRVPLALLPQRAYRGHIIALDRAARMLDVARRDTVEHRTRLSLIQADAMALPFADNSFPVVTCLEALEFLPDPEEGLAELIRVLQPASPARPYAGWLLTTNRIGWEARLMPGKTWSESELRLILNRFSLQQVTIQVWQTIYDLVWARKISPLLSDKHASHGL